jgi:hypothetical protein
VVLAIRNEYDIGIIMSSDTDLRPAVEFVAGIAGKRIETAKWEGMSPLVTPSKDTWCHVLSRKDCDSIADATDYNVPAK